MTAATSLGRVVCSGEDPSRLSIRLRLRLQPWPLSPSLALLLLLLLAEEMWAAAAEAD